MIDVLRWVLFVLTLCSDVPYLAPRSETIKQHYVGIINIIQSKILDVIQREMVGWCL